MAVELIDQVAPKNNGDFGISNDVYFIGGYRTVADLTARDAITTERRKEGMKVFVISSGDEYRLVGGIGNGDWTLVVGGGGSGDFVGPASSTTNNVVVFGDGTGKLGKEPDADVGFAGQNIVSVGNVDGVDVSALSSAYTSHAADSANPHSTSIVNIGSGTLAQLNAAVSDATLDDSAASRPPNGAASGQLSGTYPGPNVIGLRTTEGGGTNLTLGSVADGEVLVRSGTTVIGAAASSGDVAGPGSSTDNALVRFDLATGKVIQNSVVTLSDTGAMVFPTGGSISKPGTGASSEAFGAGATATAAQTTAIGGAATAGHERATVVGYNASSGGTRQVVVGHDASAASMWSTAFGDTATASGTGVCTAFGGGALASGASSIAIGPCTASNTNTIAIGASTTTATGVDAISIGNASDATATGAIVIGIVSLASGVRSLALGNNSDATMVNAIAIGDGSQSTGSDATALGVNANASGQESFACGASAVASASRAFALGAQATATAIDTISVGHNVDVTAGASIGIGADLGFSQSVLLGYTASVGTANSVAVGHAASAGGTATTAVGASCSVGGIESAGFGSSANASGDYSQAFGHEARALGSESTAIGWRADAHSNSAISIGGGSDVSAVGGLGLGYVAIVTHAQGVALGYQAQSTAAQRATFGRVAGSSTQRLSLEVSGDDFMFHGGSLAGDFMNCERSEEVLTFTAGSSLATTGLIPAGARLRAIGTYVTTTITGPTDIDIGDGSDVDRFGGTVALTAGTSTDITNWTAAGEMLFLSAGDVTITANGGNFTAGAMRVVAFYDTFTAPTS